MGLLAWLLHRAPDRRHGSNGSAVLYEETERLRSQDVEDDHEERRRMERRLIEAKHQIELARRLMMRRSTDRRPT